MPRFWSEVWHGEDCGRKERGRSHPRKPSLSSQSVPGSRRTAWPLPKGAQEPVTFEASVGLNDELPRLLAE